MSVSKDTSKGTWTVYARYTDWQGKVKILHKRGFKTKREANEFIDKMANVFAGEVERKIGGNWCKY